MKVKVLGIRLGTYSWPIEIMICEGPGSLILVGLHQDLGALKVNYSPDLCVYWHLSLGGAGRL